ncbi:MAG: hypothetical protein U5K79_07010 [Cyclobacteriaceae bacterium]|nr:hypothetical protein [Cyclobacteriaceae bacterium]
MHREALFVPRFGNKERSEFDAGGPMIVKDQAVGVINVYTKAPHDFILAEIDVLQMVTNRAAVPVKEVPTYG